MKIFFGESFEQPARKEMVITSPSFTRAELDAVLNDREHTPEAVLALFEKDFKQLFDADVGVWEGYSLREHTLMVMKQYARYFQNANIDNKKLFEVILALHDIGKPQAVSNGEKYKQHEYTKKIMKPVLTQLGYTADEIILAESLIDGDPIGTYLRQGDATTAVEAIAVMARRSKLPLERFWDMLITYYQVDAGSYTEDAGGKRSLDWLFLFDRDSRTMTFAPDIAKKIILLNEEIRKIALEMCRDETTSSR